MTPETSGTPSTPTSKRTNRHRLVLAVGAGLIAMVIGLGAVVVDLSASRAQLQSQLEQNRRDINALTKQLYWAQQQLDEAR
jgi:outer membrane murein-binding lipoprotein Lpp